MSIVIFSCDTTQVLYITRYHGTMVPDHTMVLCIYLQRHDYLDMVQRLDMSEKNCFARKGKREF
jgi:hypothetical protein